MNGEFTPEEININAIGMFRAGVDTVSLTWYNQNEVTWLHCGITGQNIPDPLAKAERISIRRILTMFGENRLLWLRDMTS